MRLIFAHWSLVPLYTWAVLSIYSKSLLEFPPVLAGLITAAFGSKLIQKNTEAKDAGTN
jgi:hypothetical protein